MSHTITITTGGGIIRHHNAITTGPASRAQILQSHDSEAPKFHVKDERWSNLFKFW